MIRFIAPLALLLAIAPAHADEAAFSADLALAASASRTWHDGQTLANIRVMAVADRLLGQWVETTVRGYEGDPLDAPEDVKAAFALRTIEQRMLEEGPHAELLLEKSALLRRLEALSAAE